MTHFVWKRLIVFIASFIGYSYSACLPGWEKHENSCFYFGSSLVTWPEAESFCQTNRGHLVGLNKANEMIWLRNNPAASSSGNTWIGLSKFSDGNIWKSIDGTTVDNALLNWGAIQQNHESSGVYCATINSESDVTATTLNSEKCSNKRNYICKAPYDDADECDVTNGFTKVGTNCFKYVGEKKTWHDANEYCIKNWNSYLASVMNDKEQGHYSNKIAEISDGLWTGLSDTESPGQLRWSNGYDNVTYNKWSSGEPNIVNVGSSCVKIISGSAEWRVDRCSREKRFFCKKGLKQTCPTGWTYGNGKCYQFYINSNIFLTWTEARDFCLAQNSQILKIQSEQEQQFIAGFYSQWKDLGILQMWLGVSDISHDDSLYWSDGTIVSYTQWDVDLAEPLNNGVPDCSWLYTGKSINNWELGNCFQLQAYACQVNEGISLSPLPLPTVSYKCTNGWKLFKDQCYLFDVNDVGWDAAEDFCQQKEQFYSHLTSILDADENSFMSGNLGGQSWTGMTDRAVEGVWAWTDNTPLTGFFNWKVNQPNQDGDCVRIIGVDDDNAWGQWNDRPCTDTGRAICKTPATPITPIQPTPPSGGGGSSLCDADYYHYTGNHKCYKFVSKFKRQWADARLHCQQEGGDLVSINSPEEQAFIEYQLLLLNVGALWTGGEDSYNGPDLLPGALQQVFDGGWRWIDGSPFNYVNWNGGEPNTQGDEDCVEILTSNGLWNDISCFDSKGYICEKNDKHDHEEPEADCTSADCCFRHLGVEVGGDIRDDQLSASSQLDEGSGASRGRLNLLDQYYEDVLGIGGPGRGAWIANENDKAPWFRIDFEGWKEIRGIVTQGRNGLNQPFNQNNWVTQYTVQYMANIVTGQFEDYKEADGSIKVYDANYNQDDQVTNIFTRPILTTAIKILPTKYRKKCALRVEILGCRPTCTSSLGVSTNPIYVDFPILPDQSFSASSEQNGFEAFNSRLDYSFGDSDSSSHIILDNEKMTWDSARAQCVSDGADLCSYEDICPNGQLSDITNIQSGDVWAPIRDGYNDWVQIGDDGGSASRLCYRHNHHYSPPSWGITTGECPPWNTKQPCDLKGNVFCCPVNTKSWRPTQNSKNEWLQVDLGEFRKISAILLQGDFSTNEWVTSYYVAFSDNGQTFTNYKTAGGSVQTFPGPPDSTTAVEGFLREPISARYIRILPQTWNNNIAVRMDVLGCEVGARSDCTDQAKSFEQDTFTLDCPGGCDAISDKLWGTGIYTDDSYICAAAIHDGRIINDLGGTVTIKKLDGISSYTGSVQHGLTSKDRTSALSGAMMFQGDHLGCPAGWEGWRDWCYYVPRKSSEVSYSEGRQRCQSLGGDLVSIHSQAEQNFVTNLVFYAYQSTQSVWIGMSDLDQVNYYKWADGSDVTYTMWDFNEPNGGEKERCVHMYKWSGFWNDIDCSSIMNSMCKMNKIPVNQAQEAVDGCPSGWVGWEASCYLFDVSPSVWTNAEDFCSDQGGHLASIESYYEQMFITGQASQTSHPDDQENFYIGLGAFVNTDGSLSYRWSSGEPVTFTAWGKNEPNIRHQCVFPFQYNGVEYYDCISFGEPFALLGPWCSADSIYTNHAVSCEGMDNGQVGCIVLDKDTGYWSQANPLGCGSQEYRICEIPRDGYTTPPIPTLPDPTGNCPSGWYAKSESTFCYQINEMLDVSQRLSWEQAKLHCESQGSNLVSIHSSEEEQVILDGITGIDERVFWIGLKRTTEGQMGWSDKTPVSYTNWAQGEPNNLNEREDCAEAWFSSDNMDWNDMNCDAVRNWICKVQRGKELLPPVVIPTVTLSPQICGSDVDWVAYTSSYTNVQKCYHFGSTPLKSWHTANTHCQTLGGTLVSIGTVDEQVFITGRTYTTGIDVLWIGLVQDTMNGPFIWVDGTPVTFRNWRGDGQPNNNFGQELCVSLDSNTGLWSDANCGVPEGYICQKYPGAKPGTPQPTPVVEGGCPVNWLSYGSKCYLEVGFTDSSLRDTWENAESYCLDKGGTLASIPNQYYNAFLTSQLYTAGANIWIGLNSRGTDLTFKWSNNEEVYFTNWSPEEPNNWEGQEECTELIWQGDNAGKWNDHRCSEIRPFFCSRVKNLDFPPDYQPDNFLCPKGHDFVQWDTGCYKIYSEQADWKTWEEARTQCKTEGQSLGIQMDLASIWNVYENKFVMSYFWPQSSQQFDDMWIGLYYEYNDTTGGNMFKWSDHSPMVYTEWGTNQPQIPTNQKGCVVMNKYGTWGLSNTEEYPVTCSQTILPYVCKYETLTIPEQDPGVGTCEEGWGGLGDYCYKAIPGDNNLDQRTWGDADRECQTRMGYLASIHSEIENKAIQSWTGQKNVWIGLGRNGWGGWDWMDKTPLDFTKWEDGEPNDASDGVEACVEMYINGKWNDQYCSELKGYVCKKHKTYSTCSISQNLRIDCGYPGINMYECNTRGCCWDEAGLGPHTCYYSQADSECLNKGGTCKDYRQNVCELGYETLLCSGGNENRCCFECDDDDATCQSEVIGWEQGDQECESGGYGTCQYNTNYCESSVYETGKCGGPAERQCCVNNPFTGPPDPYPTTTTPAKKPSTTTTKPGDTPSVTTAKQQQTDGPTIISDPAQNEGLGGGAIAGIVISVVFIITGVAAAIYLFKRDDFNMSSLKLSSKQSPSTSLSGFDNPIMFSKETEEMKSKDEYDV